MSALAIWFSASWLVAFAVVPAWAILYLAADRKPSTNSSDNGGD